MPLPDEPVAELGPHAEEHLELVAVAGESPLVDEPQRLLDEPVVVRRHRRVAAAVEERLERVDEAHAHGLVVRNWISSDSM